MPDPAPKRRRHLVVSVRVLLAAVLILGVVLARAANRARGRAEAYRMVHVYHGVTYDPRHPDRAPLLPKWPHLSAWLYRQFGEMAFHDMISLHLSYMPVYDDDVRLLTSWFDELEALSLPGSDISDDGMAHVARLAHLRELDLNDTRIGDAGLARIAGLRELEELRLRNTRVTDAGLVHLLGMRHLKRIDLDGSDVSLAGLARLKGLPELKEVSQRMPNGGRRDRVRIPLRP